MTALVQQLIKEMKSHPVTMLTVIVLVFSAWWGYSNFAKASEVQAVNSKIDRVLEIQIAATLRDLQAEYCRANGNKTVILNTIEEYERQYRDLTGKRYPLPPCHK